MREQITHTAETTQSPWEAHILKVPLDHVNDREDGKFYINISGDISPAVWVDDLQCWFLLERQPNGSLSSHPVWLNEDAQWIKGSSLTFSQRPPAYLAKRYLYVNLPPKPAVRTKPNKPVPEIIHYIWIGDNAIPDDLKKTMTDNAARCPSWRFILHVHALNKKTLKRIRHQFPSEGRIIIKNLSLNPDFMTFLLTDSGSFYQRFLEEEHKNYGAASDILRLDVLNRYGGIYMDVDDKITSQIPTGYRLYATHNEVLLHGMLNISVYNFNGFGNSLIACHPGNPVIMAMLDEQTSRLQNAPCFFHKQRPWYTASTKLPEGEMLDYLKNIFYLTGPVMFTDVLKKLHPEYFLLESNLVTAYKALNVSPSEPRIICNDYLEALENTVRYHFPFAGPEFSVKVGHAHSWNPVRKNNN